MPTSSPRRPTGACKNVCRVGIVLFTIHLYQVFFELIVPLHKESTLMLQCDASSSIMVAYIVAAPVLILTMVFGEDWITK